jgi:hypothetical protein
MKIVIDVILFLCILAGVFILGAIAGVVFCNKVGKSDKFESVQNNQSKPDIIDDIVVLNHGDDEKIYRKRKGIKRFSCTTCYCEFDAPPNKYKEEIFDAGVAYKCNCPECGTECWDDDSVL